MVINQYNFKFRHCPLLQNRGFLYDMLMLFVKETSLHKLYQSLKITDLNALSHLLERFSQFLHQIHFYTEIDG